MHRCLVRLILRAEQPIPGGPRAIGPADEPALVAQVQANPDATLAEHCSRWQASYGLSVEVSAPMLLAGAVDTAAFVAYVEQVL